MEMERSRFTGYRRIAARGRQITLTALRSEGFLAMSGQIVDATIVATPKQRNTIEEKKAIKEGQIPADWKDACEARAERPGRALDGQILQCEAA
jgi:hypothetical protein